MSGSAALTAEPLPPWLENVWNTSRLYPSFCVLACWRNESGISSPVSEVKGHGCNAKLHRCPCGELDALTRFMSNFGPNLLVTWKTARRLQQRGFFDMLRVRSKLDEQISERVIGYLLTHDKEMRHSACSVGGDISSHLSRCAARRSCNVGTFDKVFLGRGD